MIRPGRTQRTARAGPRGQGPRRPSGAEAEPVLGPFGRLTLLVCGAFLLAGILWPQGAGALLRLLIAALVVGFVLARAYEALLPARAGRAEPSPFDGDVLARTPPAEPTRLRDLRRRLAAADEARQSARATIPWIIRQTIIREASSRLARRHGLVLEDAGDDAAIRRLVSEPTWRVLHETETAPTPVPLMDLDRILDDLESL